MHLVWPDGNVSVDRQPDAGHSRHVESDLHLTDDYEPIDCSLHDRIEEAASLGRIVNIVYDAEDGVAEIDDRITDCFVRDGAEYMTTAGGLSVRLDRLRSVDGVSFRN